MWMFIIAFTMQSNSSVYKFIVYKKEQETPK